MATTTIARRTRFARQPLAGLGRLTVAALVGLALVLVALQIVAESFPSPILMALAAIALVFAAAVAVGWRWAPLLGTLLFGLMAALLLLDVTQTIYNLSHPAGGLFPTMLIEVALLIVGLGASIGATVQNYRGGERRSPRWLPGALLLLTGLVAGAIAVAAIPAAGQAAGISPAMLSTMQVVTLEKFYGAEVHVKAGEVATLQLENSESIVHEFVVDELGVAAPMPGHQTSLALFKPTAPGRYTFYCTPHYDKASGRGMHGTLVVE